MIDIFAELDKKFKIVEKTRNLSVYLQEEEEYNLYGNHKTFFQLFYIAFHKWEHNDNFEDLADMVEKLKIAKVERGYGYKRDVTVKFIINNIIQSCKFLQLVKNATIFLRKEYSLLGSNIFDAVDNKINVIVQKANLEFVYDEKRKYYKLIDNKPLMKELAERTDKELAYRLYEYNASDNKQNIDKKREILLYLGTHTESITKGNKSTGYLSKLYDTLDFALNNLHVRHDNKNLKKSKNFIVNLTKSDQIQLYDKIFDLFLAVLIINNTSKSLEDIIDLKNKFDHKVLT